jgi:hypothetical protein
MITITVAISIKVNPAEPRLRMASPVHRKTRAPAIAVARSTTWSGRSRIHALFRLPLFADSLLDGVGRSADGCLPRPHDTLFASDFAAGEDRARRVRRDARGCARGAPAGIR